MIKKLLLSACILLLSIFIMTNGVQAAPFSGVCGESAQWKIEGNQLTISGTGEVTSFEWQKYANDIKVMVVEDGITSLPAHAFYNLWNLKEAHIPDSVTFIGNSAFYGCKDLVSIRIPQNITILSSDIFHLCTSLESVELPSGLTEIKDSAFRDCANLKAIEIPQSVISIGDHAFVQCYALERISLPNNLEFLGRSAFQSCSNIKSAVLGEKMTKIQSRTFMGCSEIKEIIIPETVKQIGDEAFALCVKLESIKLSASITRIAKGTFSGCIALKEISIPNGVERIESDLFRECSNLQNVEIPDSVRVIEEEAFYGCASLTEVIIPEGVSEIEGFAFEKCTKLKVVHFPTTIEKCGKGAFKECKDLESVYITDLDAWCRIQFWGIEESNYYEYAITENTATPMYYAEEIYLNGKPIREVIISEDISQLGNAIFCGWDNLEKVTLHDNITEIGNHLFTDCINLKTVQLSSKLKKIPGFTFTNCRSLKTLVLPDTVLSIGKAAFRWCSSLEYLWLGNSLFSMDVAALECCKNLYSIVFPATFDSNKISISECDNLQAVYVLNPDFAIALLADKIPVYSYEGSASQKRCEDIGAPFGILCEESHPCISEIHRFASCTQTGERTDRCVLCNEEFEHTVPKLKHRLENQICVECGWTEPFSDVPADAWYAEAVDYAVANGLMNGVGQNRFEPNANMTRAMLVTVLWRYAGSVEEGTVDFTDVERYQWYGMAVAWAAHNGIVGGVGNNKFDPNGNITREQLAVILYRYADNNGFDTSATADLRDFPDGNRVSSYAIDAIRWAVAEGLLNGSDGKLMPQGNATRAQVATILMRFIEKFK